jgi:YidC/Oxa1 family membrane protein insertase
MERMIRNGLEAAFGYFYDAVYSLIGSHGVTLILMSAIVTLVITPFTRYASAKQMKEKHIQDVLKPQLDKIRAESSGAARHSRISALYKRYAYHPLYSLRMALGLLTQIPFLMAAYHFLRNYKVLEGQHFLFIGDLSSPDMILWGVNLLPLAMTLINMLSACVTPGFGRKETLRAWVIALLFLALLYTSPAALLLFWTCNNLWGLLENVRLYYVSEGKNPIASMFGNFFMTLRSLRVSYAESGFAKFAHLAVFLVVAQAVLSASSAHLSQFDFAETVIAAALCLFMLIFQAFFTILGEKRWLKALTWISAALLAGLFYGSFWRYLPFDINDVSNAHGILFLISDFFASISRNEAHNARLIVLGLFICLVIILVLSGMRERKSQIPEDRKPSVWDYAMIALSAAAPATFQAFNNLDYLSARTAWIYYLVLVALAFAVYFSAAFLWSGRLHKKDTALAVSLFMFCLIINPSIQGYFKRYGSSTLVFAAVFLPVMALAVSKKRNSRNITLLLAVSMIFPIINFLRTPDFMDLNESEPVSIEESVEIPAANRDSVFLLVYDATPDLDTLDALGVDSTPLRKILQNYGFKVYPDTYSIGEYSLESMGLTYDITYDINYLGHWLPDLCAGNSKVFLTFSQNSYGTYNIQSNYMTRGKSFTDDSVQLRLKNDYKEGLLTILPLITRGIFIGEFRFDLIGTLESKYFSDESFHEFLRGDAASKNGPWFTAVHYNLPGHAQSSGALRPNETELFIERYVAALAEMEKDIETILQNKSSSIIIVIGDHGPYLTGDGYILANYSIEEITELMIRDRFGTLVAIHWPDPERASKYDKNLLVNQDIFPVVFAYLVDSVKPLDLMAKGGKKAVFKGRIFIDNGVFIKQHDP